jgi:hypothetical protein
VTQQDAAYSTDGSNIIFDAAPASGDSIEIRTLSAVAMSYAPMAGSVVTGIIADGAVTTGKIADSSITTAKIAAGAVVQADIGTNVAGTGPAFSVYKSTSSGTQSITSNAWNKVTFDIEDYDTNSNFTSSRFTPTVAGYYQINAEIDSSGTSFIFCAIFKNGSEFRRGSGSSGSEIYSAVASLVYLNGSTDYVEIYILSSGGTGNVFATTGGQYTYFNGCLVKAA